MSLTTNDIIAMILKESVTEAAVVDLFPPERSPLYPVLIRHKFAPVDSNKFTFQTGDVGVMHVYERGNRQIKFTMSRILGKKHWIIVDTTGEAPTAEGTGPVSLDRHLMQLDFDEYQGDTSSDIKVGDGDQSIADTMGTNNIAPEPEPQREAFMPVNTNTMAKNMIAAYRKATKTTTPVIDRDFLDVAQSVRSKNMAGAKQKLRSYLDTNDDRLISKVLAAATASTPLK